MYPFYFDTCSSLLLKQFLEYTTSELATWVSGLLSRLALSLFTA